MKFLATLVGLLFATTLLAQEPPQRIVRFSATTITGVNSVVPALSWCTETLAPGVDPGSSPNCATTPKKVATGCAATGPANWAGAKAASGSLSLPAITINTTYNLNCSWPDDTTIDVSWTNPTQNTNGTTLTDLDSVVLAFRQGAGAITSACTPPVRCETVKPPVSPKSFINFAVGTWRIVGFAKNTPGAFSAPTTEVTVVKLAASTIARQVSITVSATPETLTNFGAE